MAKGPKTQAVVDLLVSSGSFSFWQTQKFSIQSGTYAYFMIYNICTGFSFAITNNLGDVLFRSFVRTFAQCTASTLSLAITRNNRKNPIPKARSVFGTRACTIIVTAVNYFRQ